MKIVTVKIWNKGVKQAYYTDSSVCMYSGVSLVDCDFDEWDGIFSTGTYHKVADASQLELNGEEYDATVRQVRWSKYGLEQ